MVACGERGSMGEQLLDGPVTILFSDVEGSTDVRTERGADVRPAEDRDQKVGAP
jgi:class 3 adenylate cyclase